MTQQVQRTRSKVLTVEYREFTLFTDPRLERAYSDLTALLFQELMNGSSLAAALLPSSKRIRDVEYTGSQVDVIIPPNQVDSPKIVNQCGFAASNFESLPHPTLFIFPFFLPTLADRDLVGQTSVGPRERG
jgi:hypothetical protein